MIVVQDNIEVEANNLELLLQLFETYKPEAANRGLEFVEALVSPPLNTRTAPATLWLRWQVADTAAWWGMRAQSARPSVAAVWQQVDKLCLRRERTYMLAENSVQLEPGQDLASYEKTTQGYRETAQLSLRSELTEEQRSAFTGLLEQFSSALPEIILTQLSANMAPEYAAGDFTWDLLYSDMTAAESACKSEVWINQIAPTLEQFCSTCHALGMETIGAGLRKPGIKNSIKRTAYFRMLPSEVHLAPRFEADLLEMPAHIPQILNWRLSRAVPLPWNTAQCAPWTHIWEQEFESLDDLLGPYMTHPHHWAHIDRWFDLESGVRAVDADLSHAFSAATHSVLSMECV